MFTYVAMSTLGYIFLRFGLALTNLLLMLPFPFVTTFFFQSMNKVVSVLRRFLTLVVLTFCYFLNVYIFGDYYH